MGQLRLPGFKRNCKVVPLADRLLGRMTPEPTSGCWLWTGSLSVSGYGFIREGRRGSKQVLAHRAAYELFRGAIPPGLFVRHDCDNRACVNPTHLRLGTVEDNARDRTLRGRGWRGGPIAKALRTSPASLLAA